MASSRKLAAPDLSTHLKDFLAARTVAGKRLCAGYSGGLDSTVLLYLLAGLRESLGFRLQAVHVHHGLMPQADAWAAQAQVFCAALAVPLSVERVQVESGGGKGLEAAARAARQSAFQRQSADALLLAQHADDQAETVLFRLLRGAGTRGLAAMAEAARLPSGLPLWRPFLTVPRAALQAFAATHDLRWSDDPSNTDRRHSRNFLRHEILPRLVARFPAAVDTLTRTAAQLAEDAALLDALADLDARGAVDDQGRLSCARLGELPPARARNLLRRWLAGHGIHTDRARLEDLLRQALAAPDAHPRLTLAGHHLRREQGWLML